MSTSRRRSSRALWTRFTHPEAPEAIYRHPDPPDRKPNPGMLLRAFGDFAIDRARSLMVGDKGSDMEAARRAGVRGLRFRGGDLAAFLAENHALP